LRRPGWVERASDAGREAREEAKDDEGYDQFGFYIAVFVVGITQASSPCCT
jgi:hypothetical protein